MTSTHWSCTYALVINVLSSSTHPCRKLFWTDRGSDSGVPPKVASADMDGGNLRNLYTGNLGNVEFIAADIEARKIYWGVHQTGMVRHYLLINPHAEIIHYALALFSCLWYFAVIGRLSVEPWMVQAG